MRRLRRGRIRVDFGSSCDYQDVFRITVNLSERKMEGKLRIGHPKCANLHLKIGKVVPVGSGKLCFFGKQFLF